MLKFLKKLKDPLSGLTHFIAALLAVVALTVLVIKASYEATVWHIVSYAIFGAGLVLLYTASTLYHWIPASKKVEDFLRRLDHMMIFVLIAGSYTPVCLVPLRGAWGWSLLGVVWGIALLGILLKIYWLHAPRWFNAVVYVAMGWLALIGIWPMMQTLQPGAMVWLFAGGLLYTLGAVIYALEKPNPWPAVFGSHEIFHVLTMLGSGAHFWLMYHYIMVLN